MICTEWQARHGLSPADYQQHFDQLVGQGYRLIKVAGYSVNDEARYAGIWQKRGGNAWQAWHGLSGQGYQQTITDLGRDNFRPTHVSVFRLKDETIFSAVWEQEAGLPWIARHGLTCSRISTALRPIGSARVSAPLRFRIRRTWRGSIRLHLGSLRRPCLGSPAQSRAQEFTRASSTRCRPAASG